MKWPTGLTNNVACKQLSSSQFLPTANLAHNQHGLQTIRPATNSANRQLSLQTTRPTVNSHNDSRPRLLNPRKTNMAENAVGLKLPVFWADHPRVWLQQAEAQFALRHITLDDTKYHYIVAALDQTTALRLIDILEAPPQANKYRLYENWKTRLTDIFGLSRDSASVDEHKVHLQTGFHRLAAHDLVIYVSKYQFGTTTIGYLGHRITSQGAFPLPAKVEAIQAFPQPTTVKGLQQFAGMVIFYHRFVPKAAYIMRPIYDALAGKPTKNSSKRLLPPKRLICTLLCSSTHKLMYQQPLQLMLQEQQLGLSWNNTSAPGNQWPFSAANFGSRSTVLSTELLAAYLTI